MRCTGTGAPVISRVTRVSAQAASSGAWRCIKPLVFILSVSARRLESLRLPAAEPP
jgi:hypothetical protein